MEINAREQLNFSIQVTERRVETLKRQPESNDDLARSEEKELQILRKKLELLPK